MVLLLRTKRKSIAILKAMPEDDQHKQRCYQNQYVNPKHRIIRIETLSAIKSESKEVFERKINDDSDPVTKHIYESIDEYFEYENDKTQSVIVTPNKERVHVKNTQNSVD